MKYLTFLIFALTSFQSNAQCNRFSDSLELVKLYTDLNGEDWKKTWDLSTNIDTWYGIQLNDEGCVSFIDLNGNDDFVLGYLNKGSGTGNHLKGTMPELNLDALKAFYVYDSIAGNISAFQHLENIQHLSFQSRESNNGIVGNISMLPNKNKLVSLNGGRNGLTGDFSAFMNQLTNIEYIYLPGNNFHGQIEDYQNNRKLFNLNCLECNLNGQVPNFSGFDSLVSMLLGSNNFTGEVPNFDKLVHLRDLDLSSNNLTGTLPNFEYLPELKSINISWNPISGECPTFSENLKLQRITIGSAELEGAIPNFNLPNLKSLLLSANNLEGELPEFNNTPKLESISLGDNNLSGIIPNLNLPELTTLWLRTNNFEGPIIEFNLPKLKWLFVDNNNITFVGNLDFIPLLNILDVRDNNLTFSSLIHNEWINKHLYEPQKDLAVYPVLRNDSILLNIDKEILDNTYYWYKNDLVFDTTSSSEVKLTEPYTEFDQFFIRWTNGTINDLELKSEKFTLLESYILVDGYVYFDENENCEFDNGEITFQENVVILTHESGLVTYLVTNEEGYFEVLLKSGHYNITSQTNGLWEDCNESFVVEEELNSLQVNIGRTPFNQCQELSIYTNVKRSFLRRCFNNEIGISYCNNGTAAAENAYFLFSLDEDIIVDSFNIEGVVDEGDGTFRFPIGNLNIGECGSLIVYVTTACDADLGSTLCFEANIYPNDICNALGSVWSGPTLDIKGECNSNKIVFLIKNVGNQDMLAPANYRILENDLNYLTESIQLDEGEEFEVTIPSNGNTFRLEVDQVENHPCSILPSVTIEGCVEMGQAMISTDYVNQFPQDDACPFSDQECYSVIGSYDPNDMLAYPIGFGEEHFIEEGTEIEYKIRFQNIGNDTAFTVFVTDTLPFELDVTTLRDLRSSHSLQLQRLDNNLLFIFSDILLVDSLTNEADSHGWLSFKVSPIDELPIGSKIENKAAIVFDFNEPIITNTVFHTIGIDFIPTNTIDLEYIDVKVSPNPTSGILQFMTKDQIIESYRLYDCSGKVVLSGIGNSLDLSSQNKGIYFIKIVFRSGMLGYEKVIKS